MRAFTYILECADGTLYAGYTTDVERRLATHNSGKASKYTRGRLPVKLVYLEECKDKETAMSREWHIKQLSRVEKLKLIEENKVK
ncbi:GIY-YIG nuclease family protein [Anaerovibrio sp.]|uniref:GIY-YIG nuclease family protein n=1 Tax=Anaerovibrio sp. TaxID=1872532 RepID=UPI00389109CF